MQSRRNGNIISRENWSRRNGGYPEMGMKHGKTRCIEEEVINNCEY